MVLRLNCSPYFYRHRRSALVALVMLLKELMAAQGRGSTFTTCALGTRRGLLWLGVEDVRCSQRFTSDMFYVRSI